jgi:hypothetical protein
LPPPQILPEHERRGRTSRSCRGRGFVGLDIGSLTEMSHDMRQPVKEPAQSWKPPSKVS